jgi:pantoate--beta-alanine ligase
MRVATSRHQLDLALADARDPHAPGGVFVPTMGALHQGHGALVAQAARIARDEGITHVVASVFVNPTQFNDPADLARYPRTLDADIALCEAHGATVVFAPSVDEVYPDPARVRLHDALLPADIARLVPPVATLPGLEDAHRPGHFAGVCQVVARLFDLVRPAAAVFGEKDWQQLQVIRAMVQRLAAEPSDAARPAARVRIIPGPTVREPDGVAMSSRNRFLDPAWRARAAAIPAAWRAAQAIPDLAHAERTMARILTDAGLAVEYAAIRDAATLMPISSPAAPARALIAARAGSVRLLDNAPWPAPL